ncbi:MAG: hypothetical protein KF789_12315 [Bdellovibrionaceae bacterium]|nr:hypothetical protein [Pseudobdellovibrionaceae bacterium]
MRPSGTFLVMLACAFGMVACEGRDFFEELSPEPVSALNGIYREKTTQAASEDPEAYSELSIQDGNVSFVTLNPQDASSEQTLIARLSPGEGISYQMERTEDLTTLSGRDGRAEFLAKVFSEDSKVRLLRQGNDLKVTEIRGSYRRTTTWEKLATTVTPEGHTVSRSLLKAGTYSTEIHKLRADFIQHWGSSTMEIFEKVETRTRDNAEQVNVTPAEKLRDQDEVQTKNEDGTAGKYSLRINRLKLVSAREALINDAHPAELKFSLRYHQQKRANALYLVVESAADPVKYQARSIEGFVETEETGFRLVYLPEKDIGYQVLINRFFPQGTTGQTPTTPTESESEKPSQDTPTENQVPVLAAP